jgi:hypothetical protein
MEGGETVAATGDWCRDVLGLESWRALSLDCAPNRGQQGLPLFARNRNSERKQRFETAKFKGTNWNKNKEKEQKREEERKFYVNVMQSFHAVWRRRIS